MKLPYHNIMEDVINTLSRGLVKQLEDTFIEGLKRKGFEFKDRYNLEQFIEKHCRCENNIDLKEKVYFVNDIPFFLYNYEIEMDLNQTKDINKVSANYGTYAYL